MAKSALAATTLAASPSASAFTATPTALIGSGSSASATAAPIISASTWTFTQGFVLGQASFLILIGVFIKYVVFENAEKNRQRKLDRGKRPPLSTTNVPSPTSTLLMEKAGYDMTSHASESADFLNVLLAQILQGYRDDLLGSGGEEGARRRVESWLNPPNGQLSWLDPISVTSLSLGNAYPLLSNARIRPADGQGGIRLEIDVDYSDALHLSLATSLLVNFPLPKFAVLPVALGVELIGVGGTLSIRIHNPPGENRQHVHMSLLPDFHLNVKTTSLLGSRAKLQDIPKLEQLVVARLRQVIHDKLVWPRYVEFGLPRLRGLRTDEPAATQGEQAGTSAPGPAALPINAPQPAVHITRPSMNGLPHPELSSLNTSPSSVSKVLPAQGGLSSSPTARQIRMPADFRSGGNAQEPISVHGFAPQRGSSTDDSVRQQQFSRQSSVIDISGGAGHAHGFKTGMHSDAAAQMRYRGATGGGVTPQTFVGGGSAAGSSTGARMGALNARNARGLAVQ